jgi:NAD(P)-dependent dehydrogenase (short-subunit alcohol dehydrogenase family)
MGKLDWKVAVITGGAGGIGRATALRMAAEGASVVVADINAEGAAKVADEVIAAGGQAVAQPTDIGKPDQVQRLMDRTMAAYGGIHILHNNAHRLYPGDADFTRLSLDAWNGALETNLTGHMLCCRYAIPRMIEQGGGSIINMSSTVAVGAYDLNVGYGVAKAGLMALARYVATMHGKDGIRCNTLITGFVLTRPDTRLAWRRDVWRQNILTPALGQPDDLASVVVFLASDEARYVQGASIEVSGGLLAHAPELTQLRLHMDN